MDAISIRNNFQLLHKQDSKKLTTELTYFVAFVYDTKNLKIHSMIVAF
jgi:hypothetical protein